MKKEGKKENNENTIETNVQERALVFMKDYNSFLNQVKRNISHEYDNESAHHVVKKQINQENSDYFVSDFGCHLSVPACESVHLQDTLHWV